MFPEKFNVLFMIFFTLQPSHKSAWMLKNNNKKTNINRLIDMKIVLFRKINI